jgi:hypothetical protein
MAFTSAFAVTVPQAAEKALWFEVPGAAQANERALFRSHLGNPSIGAPV